MKSFTNKMIVKPLQTPPANENGSEKEAFLAHLQYLIQEAQVNGWSHTVFFLEKTIEAMEQLDS